MEIDLKQLSPIQTYFLMTQTLVPRPIAWVLSENRDGRFNVAPYSYFTGICSSPPLILISIGKKPDGTPKDTHVNIAERADFVVHIVGNELLEPMNASSETLPADVSEVDLLGLEVERFPGSRLPRLVGCDVAYSCHLHQKLEIGNGPQTLIFGQIDTIYVADKVITVDEKGRMKVHADRLNPVARLGAAEYATLGEIKLLSRPK